MGKYQNLTHAFVSYPIDLGQMNITSYSSLNCVSKILFGLSSCAKKSIEFLIHYSSLLDSA